MKNVLLIGILGTYNYGCEAIVRGTTQILKSIDSNINVYYASYDYEADIERLKDCDLTIIKRRQRSKFAISNIVRKCCSFLNLEVIPQYDSIDFISDFDLVLSIGGDMYTVLSNGYYNKEYAVFTDKIMKKNIPVILWGCSIGPFENYPKAKLFYKKHLQNFQKIITREVVTFDYLKVLEIENKALLAPDPAFALLDENLKKERRRNQTLVIGLNLSPLSVLYDYPTIEEAINKQKEQLIQLLDNLDCEVKLLPHVFSEKTVYDNDLWFLEKLFEVIPEKYKQKVSLVSKDTGFLGIREELISCDYVLAARMHCAINSISAGIPTFFLTYSSKSKGMATYVYGNEEFVYNLSNWGTISEINLDTIDKSFNKEHISQLGEYDYRPIFKDLLNL